MNCGFPHTDLSTTTSAPPKPIGGQIVPINVTSGGVACTMNTRYEDMGSADIISLAHFPKTVVLIEYFFFKFGAPNPNCRKSDLSPICPSTFLPLR